MHKLDESQNFKRLSHLYLTHKLQEQLGFCTQLHNFNVYTDVH